MLLLRSDGNQSRQMSPTAGANRLSDRAGLAWDIFSASWPWSSPDRGKSSMGPRREAVDLLEETVPTSPPHPHPQDENSLSGSGVGGSPPSILDSFSICGKWSFELLMRDEN